MVIIIILSSSSSAAAASSWTSCWQSAYSIVVIREAALIHYSEIASSTDLIHWFAPVNDLDLKIYALQYIILTSAQCVQDVVLLCIGWMEWWWWWCDQWAEGEEIDRANAPFHAFCCFIGKGLATTTSWGRGRLPSGGCILCESKTPPARLRWIKDGRNEVSRRTYASRCWETDLGICWRNRHLVNVNCGLEHLRKEFPNRWWWGSVAEWNIANWPDQINTGLETLDSKCWMYTYLKPPTAPCCPTPGSVPFNKCGGRPDSLKLKRPRALFGESTCYISSDCRAD